MRDFENIGSRFHDLTFGVINVTLAVKDVTTLLTNEDQIYDDLENYLTQINAEMIPSQPMARTKQTARKTTADRTLPTTTAGNTTGTSAPPVQSPGGQNLATFPPQPGRFLEDDTELEQAAIMFGVGSPARSTRSQTPGSSPARGTPQCSPRRGSPAKSPGRATPGRGVPSNHGKTPVGVGRSIPPMMPRDPEPTPGTSRMNVGRRPGQSGFVSRGRGDGGAAKYSGGYNLPSFSSDDTEQMDDNNDDGENENRMEVEEDDEVDFPKLGTKNQPKSQNIPLKPNPKGSLAAKNINLIRAPKRGRKGLAEIAKWNRMARQGVYNETKRGWMAKVKRQRDENGRMIRKARYGIRALREIRFYQKSTCFLIPMLAFQHLMREVASDFKIQGQEVRWQVRALYALQEAAEAYLVALLSDSNLLAIHAIRYTLMPKDLFLVRKIRARRAVGEEVGDGTQ